MGTPLPRSSHCPLILNPLDRKFAALAAATGALQITSDRYLLDGRPHSGLVVLTPGEVVGRVGRERDDHQPG